MNIFKERSFPNWGFDWEIGKSNDGEDDFFINYFNKKTHGLIFDFGSADLITGSNSFKLVNEFNWKCVSVEANPDFWTYQTKLKNEFNLDYEFFQGALCESMSNRISFNICGDYVGFSSLNTVVRSNNVKKINVKTILISDILDKFPNPDIISIDCEGSDLNIIRSVFEKKCFPSIICIEDKNADDFILKNGYSLLKKTKSNRIFGA